MASGVVAAIQLLTVFGTLATSSAQVTIAPALATTGMFDDFVQLSSKIEELLVTELEQKCKACNTFVTAAMQLILQSEALQKQLRSGGENLCQLINLKDPNHLATCRIMSDAFGPMIVNFLATTWTTEKLCAGMLNCPTNETDDIAMEKLFTGIDSKANDTITLEFDKVNYIIDDIKCDGCYILSDFIKKDQLLPVLIGQVLRALCSTMAALHYPLASPACYIVPYVIKPLIPRSVIRNIELEKICARYRSCGAVKPGTTTIRNLLVESNRPPESRKINIPTDGLCKQCHTAVERYKSEAMRAIAVFVDKLGLCSFVTLAKFDTLFGWTVADCLAGVWRMAGSTSTASFDSINTYAVCRDYQYCGKSRYANVPWLDERFPEVRAINDVCKSCTSVVQFANYQLSQPAVQDRINQTLTDVCKAQMKSAEADCLYLVENYADDALNTFAEELDNEKDVCTNQIGVCGKNWVQRASSWFSLGRNQPNSAALAAAKAVTIAPGATKMECLTEYAYRSFIGQYGLTFRGGGAAPLVLGAMNGGQKGNVREGDRLQAINGKRTAGMTFDDVVKIVRATGSSMRLTLRRGGPPDSAYECAILP